MEQLVAAPGRTAALESIARTETRLVFALAVAAALSFKIPALFGLKFENNNEHLYLRNASFFVLPFLTLYFVWKRRLQPRQCAWLALPFIAAAVVINTFPFTRSSNTEILSALHLPIALWLVVGIAYAGGRWFELNARMNFVRFSGELFIYYVLIALGGGVFTAFTMMMFRAIGINAEWVAQAWRRC